MTGATTNPAWGRIGWPVLLVLLVLATLAGGLRLKGQKYDYWMVDEFIPGAVISHVRDTGTPDTNWANTDVYEMFRYDQYNFSSYHLAGALVTWALPLEDEQNSQVATAHELRRLNAVLGALSVLLAGLVGFRLGGPVAAALAAAFTAVHVALMQDGLYARPEAFTTVLTALLFFAATGAATWRRALAAGVLLGLLVACKVTFVLLAPFALASVWLGASPEARWRITLVFCAGALVGVVAGMPYAAMSPAQYLNGVFYLTQQYSGGHWPYGLPDGTLPERIAHSGRYLLQTVGLPGLLLFGAGAVFCVRRVERRQLVFLAGVAATAVYFLQSRVFFERNLSHALPFAFAVAGAGLAWLMSLRPMGRWLKPVVAAVLIVAIIHPAAMVSHRLLKHALPKKNAVEVAKVEAELRDAGYTILGDGHEFGRIRALAGNFCGRWAQRIEDFGDRLTRARLAELTDDGTLKVYRRVPGTFKDLQVSTLHTYHGGDNVFFVPGDRAPADCRLSLVGWPAVVSAGSTDGIALEGAAVRDGHHPGATGYPAAAAVFATWAGNDANRGRVVYDGPICRHQALPLVAGPAHSQVLLTVDAFETPGVPTRLYAGPPPRAEDAWAGLRIEIPGQDCVNVHVSADDPSDAWGTWIGLGAPLDLRAGAGIPHSTSAAGDTP